MTIYEILNFNREFLERLQRVGARLDDIAYVDLFGDFTEMVDTGEKVSYVVAVLADRYGVSERTVYNVVKRFSTTATLVRRNCPLESR